MQQEINNALQTLKQGGLILYPTDTVWGIGCDATNDEAAYDIMDIENNPITIIYDNPQNLAQNLIAEDNTIAIRIPDHEFCFQLLRKFNGAIVSTSANISGQPTPKSFKEIHEDILKGVDYVVNLQREKICNKASSIIKLSNDGTVKVIRP